MSMATEISGLDEYRKNCSVIFGNATASQLKFLEACMQLQQTAFTSCDGIISNQLKWIENYLDKNKDNSLAINQFLKICANTINGFMKLVSMSYDSTTSNIESYNRTLISMNEYFFRIKDDQRKIEDLTV